jgi:hypothetical protein
VVWCEAVLGFGYKCEAKTDFAYNLS